MGAGPSIPARTGAPHSATARSTHQSCQSHRWEPEPDVNMDYARDRADAVATEARSGTPVLQLWESKSKNSDPTANSKGRSLEPEGPGWPVPGAEPVRGRSFHTHLPGFFLRPTRLRCLRLPLGGLFVYKQITSAPPSLPSLWTRPPAALLPAPSDSEPLRCNGVISG